MTCPDPAPRALSTCRERWLAGMCPCCGDAMDNAGLNGEQAAVIGEGVTVCGWCQYRHPDSDIHAAVLREIVTGGGPRMPAPTLEGRSHP